MGATTGDYTDFKTENTPSVEQELFETAVALEIENQNYDSALALIEKRFGEISKKSSKLTEQQGTVYYKSGKMDQFMANLKDQVTKILTIKFLGII